MRIERYAYDAAGRLVREGDKTYRYGYLDKVLSVTDGKRSYAYAYHVDGQLARADYGEDGRAGGGEDGRAGSPLCGNEVTSCIDYLGAACEFHITDVRWRGYLLKDVWAECNHSFEHPNLTIVMGEKANVVYTPSLKLLIDGVMHQFQFDLHLTYSTTIKRKDRWNKEIIYQGSVTIKVIETWTEDIVDDDGNVIGHAPQRLTHSDVVKPFEGSHNIPE